MIQYQFIELVAVRCNGRIIESAFWNRKSEDSGAVAKGNSPDFL